MKLSFIPLLIVSICIILTFSLLWLHNSPKYQERDIDTKHIIPKKKSFNVLNDQVKHEDIKDRLPANSDTHNAEVLAPTLPPTELEADSKDVGSIPDEGLSELAEMVQKNLQTEEKELKGKETDFEVYHSSNESVKVAQHTVQEKPISLQELNEQPATIPVNTPLLLYRNSITMEISTETLFPQLQNAHMVSTGEQLQQARDDADTIQPNHMPISSIPSSPNELIENSFEFHTLGRLHKALKTGVTCTPATKNTGSNLYLSIQTLFSTKTNSDNTEPTIRNHPKAIIEYIPTGLPMASTVAYTIAAAYPTITALVLRFPTDTTTSLAIEESSNIYRGRMGWNAYSAECPADPAGSNFYLADGENNPLDRTGNNMDCIQIISNLEMLVNNLLPFEFEEVLGNILCRCSVTYIPQNLPDSAYFAFWDSGNHLLRSVERVIGSFCAISYDMDQHSSTLISPVRMSHIVIQRNNTITNTASYTEHKNTYGSSSSSSRYSFHTTSTQDSSPKQEEEEVTAISKKYLSVGLLSSLALTARSKLHLWSSVFTYLAGTADEASLHKANLTVSDLLVRGSAVHTAVEISKLRSSSVPRSLGVVDADVEVKKASASAPPVHHSVMSDSEPPPAHPADAVSTSTTTVPASLLSKDAVAAAVASTISPAPSSSIAAGDAAASTEAIKSVPSGVDTVSDPQHRRLYVVTKAADRTVKRTGAGAGYSSTSNTASTNNLPEEDGSLTWELPDHTPSLHTGLEEFDETDSIIQEQINLLSKQENVHDTFGSSTGRTTNKRYSITSESRDLQRHLHRREHETYRHWMSALKSQLEDSTTGITSSGMNTVSSAGLVYIMGRHISLLSLKISKLLTTGSTSERSGGLLVSLLSDSLAFHSHSVLTEMMALKNNIICRPVWSPARLAALLASPERAGLSIIQVDVIVEILISTLSQGKDDSSVPVSVAVEANCQAILLEESIAALLSMAEISYVELPSASLLRHLLSDAGISSACVDQLTLRYSHSPASLVEQSLRQLKTGVSAEISEVGVGTSEDVRIYRVGIRQVSVHSSDTRNMNKFINKQQDSAVSLYTVLQLGVVDQHRKMLLKMLIDYPLWKFKPSMSIRPWELFLCLTHPRTSDAAATKTKESPGWFLFYRSEEASVQSENLEAIDAVSRNHPSAGLHSESLHTTSKLGNNEYIVGVSQRGNTVLSDRVRGRAIWKALEFELDSHSAELAHGKFSFVEHDSGYGYVSLRIASSFPNATVISIERSADKVKHHVAMVKSLYAYNNAVCKKTESDSTICRNIYESPELFRFQLLSRSMLDGFIAAESLSDWGGMIGTMLSTALTSFIYAPTSAQVSWAMYLLYAEVFEFEPGQGGGGGSTSYFRRYNLPAVVRSLSDMFPSASSIHNRDIDTIVELNCPTQHPQFPYRDFEQQWILKNARVKGGSTAVQLSALAARDKLSEKSKDQVATGGYTIPLVRCDIVNMTRHVHHHYDYAKDGHSRTYTMRVRVNQTLSDRVLSHIGDPSQAATQPTPHGIELSTATHKSIFAAGRDVLHTDNADAGAVEGLLLPLGYHPDQHSIVGVHLFRDRDTFPIPYTSIYGVTLISALRLGLEETLRDRMFKDFLKMPLYEDMAPWNVVLMGGVSFCLFVAVVLLFCL